MWLQDDAGRGRHLAVMAALAGSWIANLADAAPYVMSSDPFEVIDPQNWVNPDNMTWADYKAPPGTNWSDPSRKGSIRNFNIALVVVDYPDMPFVITQPAGSTVFANPQEIVSGLDRSEVPAFYRDLLNKPTELNQGHTLHEYWMEDSAGRYGVDLTVFGAYELPDKSYQYGIDPRGFNPDACPSGDECRSDLRSHAFALWRADVGDEEADSYELAFILSAGQDESSTWQEFGEMKFQTKEDVPEEFGPPDDALPNYAATRYVEWTSWVSAATIWPNAATGSSTQAESSGLGTYAHELSHLLGIGDNYNNPYGEPARRAYTGPWSMLSRGSFNGPGGPHTRWQIPALQGGSLGCLHTMQDKMRIGLVDNSSVVMITRDELAETGPVVAKITARSVDPGEDGLMGVHIRMGSDLSEECDVNTDPYCDGGGYQNYNIEVVDRMGADSFTPDSGVHISKTKDQDRQPFQWTIDANPQDIDVVDYYRPDGTPSMLSIGDYRQLADALFHAGTRSGSKSEHIDEANRLHLYVVDVDRDSTGVLHYTVGARSLDGNGASTYGLEVGEGYVAEGRSAVKRATTVGVTCVFELANTGEYVDSEGEHAQDLASYRADLYRLSAEVEGEGWRVELPNELAAVKFGEKATAKVAVAATDTGTSTAVVKLTVASESDSSVSVTKECKVSK